MSDTPGLLLSDLWPFNKEQIMNLRRLFFRDLVSSSGVESIIVSDGGTGYTDGDFVVIEDSAAGTGAEGYINVINGTIVSVKMIDNGSGYALATTFVDAPVGAGASFTPVIASTKISSYNRATNTEFWSDDDINSVLLNLLDDKLESLHEAYLERYNERIDYGDTQAQSIAIATAEQLMVLYRFLRADFREAALNDPGYIGSVAEHAREKFFEQWNKQIVADRQWSKQRTGGFSSVALEIR